MDYIEQTEKIFTYLKFNLEFNELESLLNLKKNFNNDLNLIGCFVKDYLILNYKHKNFNDEDLYNEFVLFYENKIQNDSNKKQELINDILKFSKYYISIVFEEFSDIQILSAISTINLCYSMDCYPLIMKILDDYSQERINNSCAIRMLQALSSAVLNRFENPNDYNIDFYNVTIDKTGTIYTNEKFCNKILERIAI